MSKADAARPAAHTPVTNGQSYPLPSSGAPTSSQAWTSVQPLSPPEPEPRMTNGLPAISTVTEGGGDATAKANLSSTSKSTPRRRRRGSNTQQHMANAASIYGTGAPLPRRPHTSGGTRASKPATNARRLVSPVNVKVRKPADQTVVDGGSALDMRDNLGLVEGMSLASDSDDDLTNMAFGASQASAASRKSRSKPNRRPRTRNKSKRRTRSRSRSRSKRRAASAAPRRRRRGKRAGTAAQAATTGDARRGSVEPPPAEAAASSSVSKPHAESAVVQRVPNNRGSVQSLAAHPGGSPTTFGVAFMRDGSPRSRASLFSPDDVEQSDTKQDPFVRMRRTGV